MTTQERDAEFEVWWNGAVVPGTDADLFRKPTLDEQKQPDGYDKDAPALARGLVMTVKARNRRRGQRGRAFKDRRKERASKSYQPALEWCA